MLAILERGSYKSEIVISQRIETLSKQIDVLAKSKDPTLIARKEEFITAIENYQHTFNAFLGGLPETGVTTESLNKTLGILRNL